MCVCVFIRLSNICCSICQVLLSSQHMRFWFCSGLRFTIRLYFVCSWLAQIHIFGINWFYYDFATCIEQARAVSTDGLKPTFFTVNAVVYAVQVKILLHCFTINPGGREDSKLNSFYVEASHAPWKLKKVLFL